MTSDPPTGPPSRSDRPAEIAETEQARLDDALVMSRAEGVVAAARMLDLVAQQQAAYRRLSAAKGRLPRARKDGSAQKIAAAAAQ